MILIVWAIILIIILTVIVMKMKVTWGWIFNLCFCLFVDRKLTTYLLFDYCRSFCYLYFIFKCDLNWIIKWTNLNTMNSIIQISEYSWFFNDDDNFMLVISLKPTKQINLYWFKIHIFYRKLALHKNSAQIYYFD